MADNNWESFSEISVEIPSSETESFMAASDDGGEGDTAALLPGAPPSTAKQMPTVFSIEFYRRCWDVTTNEVRLRIKSALYPRKDFISSLHGKPDLYGPFWVAVTLCFSTAICGNLSNFIQNHGNPEFQYTPEFERVTSAASAIFGYAFVFPFLLSVILYYSKIMTGFSTIELLTAYGYSLSVFIPISFVWMIPVEWIRWALVIVGALVSGSVVAMPIWRGLKVVANKKYAYGILALAVAANIALAVGFKMYFFESPLLRVDNGAVDVAMAIQPESIQSEPELPKELVPVESVPIEAAEVLPPADPVVADNLEVVEQPADVAADPIEIPNDVPEHEEKDVPIEPAVPAPAEVAEPVEALAAEAAEEQHEEDTQQILSQLHRVDLVKSPLIPANPALPADVEVQPVLEPAAPIIAENPAEAEPAILLPRVG